MKLKALVVEDDYASLELLCEGLNAAGIEAQGTNNPVQASTMIEEDKFDGIFLDLSMPGLDGLELCRRIRKSEPNATTPIVVVSGRTDRDTMKSAFSCGAQFYLAKPLDRMKLRRLLATTQGSMLRERLRNCPVQMRAPLSCRSRGGELHGITTQISEKGMVFQFDGVLRPGELVHLSFRFPDCERPVDVAATVLRVMRTESQQRAGCRFESMPPSARDALRQFVLASSL